MASSMAIAQKQLCTSSANTPAFFSSSSSTMPGGASASLKTRMLQDARRERQRVLDIAAGNAASMATSAPQSAPPALLAAPLRARAPPPPPISTAPNSTEQAAQTDLVTILAPGAAPGPGAATGLARMPPIHEDDCGAFLSSAPQSSRPGSPVRTARDQDRTDDDAQAEALQTLRSLAQSPKAASPKVSLTQVHAKPCDAELQKERAARKDFETRLAGEKKKTQATKEQVLCLEQELDGKEEALHRVERALESRDTELEQAQHSLAQLRAELFATQQLLMKTTTDRDRQLSHKHQYIQSFFDMIKQQQGSILEGELSTSCSSDRDSDDRGSDQGSGSHSLDSSLRSERGSGHSFQSMHSYTARSSVV